MRHVITRGRAPVSRFGFRNLTVSLKARYVNDVHLPRFGGGRGATRPTIGRPPRNAALFGTATRKQGALRGVKGFLPLERLE